MSYILDALKRADAERERGQVPGLHAQPMPVTAEQRTGMAAPWRWLIGAAVVVALAGVSWQMSQREAAAPVVTAAAPVPSPSPSPTAQPPVAAATEAATPAATAAPAAPEPAPPARPKPKAKPPQPANLLPRPVVPKPAPRKEDKAPAAPAAPVTAAAPAAGTASSAAAAAPPAPEPRVYAITELPQDVRRDLPKLAVTGSVYSANPAQRMLILNGQVFNEGGHPTPDSVLERIGPSSAVLSFRGMRYTLPY
ncbi:MAG: general secretion pathway protein GspB [Ramlibacter sp.]|nr:general secretion pathway protein GspB [Ramlibacter sp.]